MIGVWNENKRDRLERAIEDEKIDGKYRSIIDGKINRCEERAVLEDYPSLTSVEETDYFRVYENRFPKRQERLGITVQPTIGAEEDIDDDRMPNYIDPDRDGDRVPDVIDTNYGTRDHPESPPAGSMALMPDILPLLPTIFKRSDYLDPFLRPWNLPGEWPEAYDDPPSGDKNPTGLSDEKLPKNTEVPGEKYEVPHNLK